MNISNLNLKIVISFIYIFLGYKRIELLAILVVALFYYLFDRYSKTTSRKYIVPGIIAILICSVTNAGELFSIFLTDRPIDRRFQRR